MNFNCPRTCPAFNDRWCRFNVLFSGMVHLRVDSHTARVKVDYNNADQLRAAVEKIGGTWLGHGSHELFERNDAGKRRTETGLGFTLPNWNYPLIVTDAGQLAYDDYNGKWGNVEDLVKLQAEYAWAHVEQQAANIGWQTERVSGSLVVYHPEGGTLTLSAAGECETAGFVGSGCHVARETLGLSVIPGTLVETGEAGLSQQRIEESM